MPKRSTVPPKRSRGHALPVRVVPRSAAPKLPPIEEPRPQPVKQAAPPVASPGPVAVDVASRTRVVWIGTVIVLAVVIVAWLVTVGAGLTKPGQSDSLWLKIRTNLRAAWSGKAVPEQATTPAEREFNELDERLFPNVP